ncbi:MAG: hypothetical protein AAGF92_22595 [Myxococcota bacterium]
MLRGIAVALFAASVASLGCQLVVDFDEPIPDEGTGGSALGGNDGQGGSGGSAGSAGQSGDAAVGGSGGAP